jgi:hypothetical protein
LRKIQWCLILETDPMRRACHAEALCQIVRTEGWRPKDGSSIELLVGSDETECKTRSLYVFIWMEI